MRDGSLEDVVEMWIGRMIEERGLRHPVEDEAAVYFTLLKRAVYGLLQTHEGNVKPSVNYREMLTNVLRKVRQEVERLTGVEPEIDDEVEPTLGEIFEPAQSSAVPPHGKHSEYWSSHSWRKDFYTTFNQWFWNMKDYAHAAGRRKSDSCGMWRRFGWPRQRLHWSTTPRTTASAGSRRHRCCAIMPT